MDEHGTAGYTPELEPLLTVASTCHLLRVSRQTVYRLVRAGQLNPTRVGERLTNADPLFQSGDPSEERFFAPSASDARFVLWNVEPEGEAVAKLRSAGLDAREVPYST